MDNPTESMDRPTSLEQAQFEADLGEFFDLLIEKRKKGEISHGEALEFFPKEVRERDAKMKLG